MLNELICKGAQLLKIFIDNLTINLNCPGHPARDEVKLIWRVTDPRTTNYFEGEHLAMNLKNTQCVNIEVSPKNRLGGPASVENATFTANAPTNAFSVGPNPDDPSNPLKARITADPNSPGGPDDMGVVSFDCDAKIGEEIDMKHGELAINIVPADAELVEIVAGEAIEQ